MNDRSKINMAGFFLPQVAIVMVLALCAFASEETDKRPQVKSYKMQAIKNVLIKENGVLAKNHIENEKKVIACDKFKLTENDVRAFFRLSRQEEYRPDLRSNIATTCHSSGELTLENGDKGQWLISMGRNGFIELRNGIFLDFCCATCLAGLYDDPYEDGEKSGEVRPYKMSKIKSINITENGAWQDAGNDPNETPQMCRSFKLAKNDIKDYFRRAERVSHDEFHEFLFSSSCYAAGVVTFINGDQGKWQIDFERKGIITLSDGRKLNFFCPRCRGKVFYP